LPDGRWPLIFMLYISLGINLAAMVAMWLLWREMKKAQVEGAKVAPLTQALHDTTARVSSLEGEVAGLHAKARELDEAEAIDVIASRDLDRAIGFLRKSLPW
jgi:cell division protein FtsL